MLSKFQKAREAIWGTPGFDNRRSTVTSSGLSWQPDSSYIIELVRNSDSWALFLQMVNEEGGQQLVLPDRVCAAIFRQYESIMANARKQRAVRAAETRIMKAKRGITPVIVPDGDTAHR